MSELQMLASDHEQPLHNEVHVAAAVVCWVVASLRERIAISCCSKCSVGEILLQV